MCEWLWIVLKVWLQWRGLSIMVWKQWRKLIFVYLIVIAALKWNSLYLSKLNWFEGVWMIVHKVKVRLRCMDRAYLLGYGDDEEDWYFNIMLWLFC